MTTNNRKRKIFLLPLIFTPEEIDDIPDLFVLENLTVWRHDGTAKPNGTIQVAVGTVSDQRKEWRRWNKFFGDRSVPCARYAMTGRTVDSEEPSPCGYR
jgi:hypothetical protein